MPSGFNKFYLLLAIICITGYVYLFLSLQETRNIQRSLAFCPLEHVTGIPCPTCGSTHAVMAITRGEFKSAMLFNPMGYIVAVFMIMLPPWILYDKISKRHTLYEIYHKTEKLLKKPAHYVPLIAVVLLNWLWNISKAL